VPAGAPDQRSSGDTFCPVHPDASYACSSWIVPPGWKSRLVRRNCASAVPAAKLTVVKNVAARISESAIIEGSCR
jgi:hypothetical protein